MDILKNKEYRADKLVRIMTTYHMFEHRGEFAVFFALIDIFQGSSRHNVRSGSLKKASSLMYRSGNH